MESSSPLAPITKRLEGKVALITGGASGIGESTARLFAHHGAKVVIADIQSELGHSVAEKIRSETGQPVIYVDCNVVNETEVENAINKTVSVYGKLDIMFNNAGIAGSLNASISSAEREDFMRVLEVNVYGGVLGAKHAARVMIPRKKGCILFTASLASALYGAQHAYTASKHAVVGLTKNLAVELGQYGIRVNCISPGPVPTALITKPLGLDAKQVQEWGSEMANLKEVKLDADDVAEAALYLASDDSKFVSGLNLFVDGAASLPVTTKILKH
ncbi:hypothetical protein JCGZ_08741 [Jatropha curcas]|uniref:Ketoreductase domain-containing protein n=1 Tax=Jatropha curcas TaxID=180498 RepID=A0A067KIZ0_JATCU|nr:secoisolariciresinol dehydrogenase [Jatropha curcas]KDP36097.1 hypothetical protein JCGZ_08741 [Jatropha curcas]